jgi:hypothetical protein
MSDQRDDRFAEIVQRLAALELASRRPKGEIPSAGSSFPTGIPTGFLFYRTDLGWWCFYDGIRWLTSHEYSLSSGLRVAPSPGTYVIGPMRQDYAPYFTRVARLINTGVTHNGSNWVQITVLGANATQSATTNIDVASTAAQGANTWATNDSAPSVTATPANAAALDFTIANAGSPSNLQNLVLNVFYRLIVP